MAFLRVDRGIVRGKKFATRKAAREYVLRNADGHFRDPKDHVPSNGRVIGAQKTFIRVNGRTEVDAFSQESVTIPDKPRKPRPAKALDCFRVRPIPSMGDGVWRRYIQGDGYWRFVSDHSTMDDALAGTNPIGVDPEFDRSNEHVQSDRDFD